MPGPDVNIDPVAVHKVTAVMNHNEQFIIEKLGTLLSSVTDLLTDGGGLWLKQSSPVMTADFAVFAKNLSDAIANIKSFATSFDETAKSFENLDNQYANPSDS